ncbi:hypothetical protein NHX12_025229 [Muraenolepis orangiensis]|uniref:Sulfotransferase n=1 Tax=Muraenolepis orangiensis TaxID=630683 RepID=A0A9Q0EIX1_9TELE|nr:hypothetical protein NHX12_025229 [Muraenolepis orangiensis]
MLLGAYPRRRYGVRAAPPPLRRPWPYVLSVLVTYVCYCALFSADATVVVIVRRAPPGERRLQKKSVSCVLPFDEKMEEEERDPAAAGSRSSSSSSSAKFGNKELPSALIVGVKKGGTRAVLEFIRIHPDVRAVGTETHFFDRNHERGLDWYRSLMPRTLEGQISMEKTPSYFVTAEAPRRIAAMSRHTRLIVVVRDPVTRAISDYTQTLTKSPHLPSFQELAFRNQGLGSVDASWNAIRIGLYALHLERWLSHFPLQQIHFVSGERLVSDPAGELGRLQDFLGLKRIVTDKHFYFNRTKGFPCLKKPESGASPRCLGKTKGRTHVAIDRWAIQRLRDFYRPHNVRFYQMVGQDFRWE